MRGGRGHCDRYGHDREVQPQQTVPLQTLGCYGQYQFGVLIGFDVSEQWSIWVYCSIYLVPYI